MSSMTRFSHSGPGRPTWLVTFADLVALMIAFFVMLFATQKVDVGKWEKLVEALSQRLNPEQTVVIGRPSAARSVQRLSAVKAIDLDYLEAVIRDKTALDPLLAGLDLRRYDDRLVIALPAELLFPPGAAVPVASAQPILYSLASVLGSIGNRIDVVGHADPTVLRETIFMSNWQLSIARALVVADALRDAGYHRELSPAGVGATHYDRLDPSLQGARRRAVARRVDVVIWPTRGSGK